RSGPEPAGSPDQTQVVAHLLNERNARWSKPESEPGFAINTSISNRADITSGQPLALDAGLVALKLASGVQLLVEGPARWAIVGENQVRFDQGRLVATVPPAARGFQVDAPNVRLIDQGTEFGVEVLTSDE